MIRSQHVIPLLLAAAGLLGCQSEPPVAPADPSPAPAAAEPGAPAVEPAPVSTPRTKKRKALREEVSRMPGWRMTETAHYFVLTDIDDLALVRELEEHAEATRRRFREDLPHPRADPVPIHGATSVLRVLADREGYFAYGGGFGGEGYWKPALEEIVVVLPSEAERRAGAWPALQSTLLFEYLDTSYGRGLAAPWFVYGHALYYGNFARVDGAWIERPDPTRAANLDRSLEAGRALPLRELVELETGTYQRGIPDGPSPRELDAQAWAFVRFLRSAGEASPWAALLDDYLERLQATGDPVRAREEAFAAVDWAQLEAAWWYAGWLAGG